MVAKRFEDCASCAFYRTEPAICEGCREADQWEPDVGVCDEDEPDAGYYSASARKRAAHRQTKRKTIRINKQ